MKKDVVEYIKTMLATKPEWACRAIIRLYECQTPGEQCAESTVEQNGAGFNGTDAKILSSFAQQLLRYNRGLSQKQLDIAHKRLPKYSRQVMGFIPAEKLAEIESSLEAKKVS